MHAEAAAWESDGNILLVTLVITRYGIDTSNTGTPYQLFSENWYGVPVFFCIFLR
jgi:hypothetical protein